MVFSRGLVCAALVALAGCGDPAASEPPRSRTARSGTARPREGSTAERGGAAQDAARSRAARRARGRARRPPAAGEVSNSGAGNRLNAGAPTPRLEKAELEGILSEFPPDLDRSQAELAASLLARLRSPTPEARQFALERLRAAGDGLAAIPLLPFVPEAASDEPVQGDWGEALTRLVANTKEDGVLVAVASSITPDSPQGASVVEALAQRAAKMPSGEDRRVVLESMLVFAVADGRRWEAARELWDAQNSQARKDDVAAAAAVVLSESPRRHPTDLEAAALRESIAHVFAQSRDQDIQQTLVRAAAMEVGLHMDAEFLRDLARAGHTPRVRDALSELAARVARGEGCDLDAFDDAVTPGWREE